MTAPAGISIPEGTYVLFDTGRTAVNGNLIAVQVGKDKVVTFKKIIFDGGKKCLKALNPIWPSILEIKNSYRIIGIAIETKLKLL